MKSGELKVIVDKLNEQGRMIFLEGASEEQILQFEKEHEFILPEKYKEWLRYSDGGEFFLPAGLQLYGVSHKPIIDISDNDKPGDSYIVIGALASGDPILCKEAEEKISIYDNSTGCIDDELVYQDFFDFLNNLYDLLGERE